jgi:hypothetical protein
MWKERFMTSWLPRLGAQLVEDEDGRGRILGEITLEEWIRWIRSINAEIAATEA